MILSAEEKIVLQPRDGDMGQVFVEAKIENLGDAYQASQGVIQADKVRCVTIPKALVDTGAWGLLMPKSIIDTLGLKFLSSRIAITAAGPREIRVYGTVRLTIQGRDCPMDVAELPEGCPVLIGQIPLESMDFIVDMRSHTAHSRPAIAGEHTYATLPEKQIAP